MNFQFLTYLLVYLSSSILNFVFFFKVSKVSYKKVYCIPLFFLILIEIVASGFNYLTIVISQLIIIGIMWVMLRKDMTSYSVCGVLLFVFNIEIVGDISRAIFLDLLVKIIKNPDLILIANIVLMVVPLAIILFIMWNFYDKLHREFSGSNRKILTWLIFYIYVVNIGIALTYTTTKNIPPVYFFFGIVLLLQSIFAIGIYFLMQKNQKELLKKQRMRN